MKLSQQTLQKLRGIINDQVVFRSGPQLIRFFSEFNPDAVDLYGPGFGSRRSYTDEKLNAINDKGDIARCICKAFDENLFDGDEKRRMRLLKEFNTQLVLDGWIVFAIDGKLSFRHAHDDDSTTNENEFADKDISCFREIQVDPDEPDECQPINKPFDPSLIDITTSNPTISNIVERIKHNEIDLHPAFQRAGNIWDARKQSRLIESLLLRIPLPAFYFYTNELKDKYGLQGENWQVIDGLQRLCAINNFIVEPNGARHQLKLMNLEFLAQFEGRTYEELPYNYRRIINETQLTAYLIQKDTPSNVKFNIFKRVNTGGVPLTQQEIRHALHQGVASEFLMTLANSEEFKVATGGRIPTGRMLDREFVNRFLAFYCLDRNSFGDLESFLDSVLTDIEATTDSDRNRISEAFCDSLRIIYNLFGKYSFSKLDAYPKLKPVNKVLFEVLTVSVAKLPEYDRSVLAKVDKDFALKQYVDLFKDDSYNGLSSLISTTTGDLRRIESRYQIIRAFLDRIIGCGVVVR